MKAVVKIQGNQYLVAEGDRLEVNRLNSTDKALKFKDVLLVMDDNKFTIGKPLLTDCVITAENLGEVKGEKIRVSKFKAKSRYRRTIGFRSKLNTIRIEKIAFK